MIKCKDCKFWKEHERGDQVKPPHRQCTLIVLEDTLDCREPDGYKAPESQAFVTDCENYGAFLWTRPDFGCVLGIQR